MNLKLNLNFTPKQLLGILNKFKGLATVTFAAGVLAYTVYQLSNIPNITPTDAQIDAERKSVTSSVAKFDTKTIEGIVKQTPIEVDTTPKNLGKTNPFF